MDSHAPDYEATKTVSGKIGLRRKIKLFYCAYDQLCV